MSNLVKLPVLLYDDECPLCKRFSQSLDRIEGGKNISKVSIHTDDIYGQFPFLSKDKCLEDVHYIDEDNNLLVGSEVVEHLIVKYPVVNKFAWLIEKEMGKKSVDLFYKAASSIRKCLGNCSKCSSRRK